MADDPSRGQKRKWEGVPLAQWGSDAVVAWLRACDAVPSDLIEPLCGRVAEEGVDGEVLSTLTEADLEGVLGVAKFGVRRKLHARLQALRGGEGGAAVAEPAAADNNGASGSAAAPPPPAAAPTAPPPPRRADEASGAGAGPSAPLALPAPPVLGGAPPAARPDAGAFAAARDARLARDERKAARQLAAEAACVGALTWVANKFQSALAAEPGWAAPALKAARTAELDALRQKCKLPGLTVVVLGNTGAGKSTLLNALLGETRVLPTNGMRACTAAVIELSHNPSTASGPAYEADIEFMSRAEWDAEEEALFTDLSTADGRAILSVGDPNAHNHSSYCRMVAVYGDAYTRSRVADPSGVRGAKGRVRYIAPGVDELRERLRSCRLITGALGTVRHLQADDAASFRRQVECYVDSSNDAGALSFWPLVRRVRMRGRKWDALRSGAVLVDAPGVNDDNSARDGIVKAYLKEADSIWVVSNIKRAVNDKTAKHMLGESMRRTLLMDGSYGNLVFVATQSDVLVPSEVADNLRLPHATPVAQLAAARNAFTRQRIGDDFLDGLADMSLAAGERPDRAALAARYSLPVFTVSAVDFQKLTGVRRQDGPPAVWAGDAEGTELPALRRFLHEATLLRRKASIRRHADAVVAFADGVLAYLADDGTDDAAARRAARAAFDAEAAKLSAALAAAAAAFAAALGGHVAGAVGPQLQAGAKDATKECSATARGWASMHWATYAACCRRSGAWKVNMNETLAEPVYRAVSTAWERAFVSGLKKDLDALQAAAVVCLDRFHDALAAALAAAGVPPARAAALRSPQDAAAVAAAAAAVDKARAHAAAAQKEASRTVTPKIQEQMQPGYSAGTAECGTGSAARRRALIEAHVDNTRDQMFAAAIQPVVQSLTALQKELDKLLRAGLQRLEVPLQLQYGPLWEARDAGCDAARARLLVPFRNIALEARRARQSLLDAMADAGDGDDDVAAEAGGSGAGALGDDDEIEDVTAAELARRRKAAEESRVDLTLDSDDEGAPAPQRAAPPAAAAAPRVKQEGA